MWSRARLVVVLGLGMLASFASRSVDVPGNGAWIVVCWVAGALAATVVPAWAGFGASVAGVALATLVSVTWGGQYAGLAWLVVVLEAAVLGHGFLLAATLGRARRIGSFADARVVGGLLFTVGLAIVFVLIAQEFARNPP